MKARLKNLYTKFLSKIYSTKEWKGDVTPSDSYRLVFFSHFDSKGEIHDYVVHYLKELYQNNCLIIVISTSPFMKEDAIKKIQPYCFRIILRKNIGLDFGSWRMAYDRYKKLLTNAKALLLLNDSCFGPFYSLKEPMIDFDSKKGISGITLNYEVTTHLQSYFLYLPAVCFSFFKDFFYSVQYLKDKDRIICEYEIGFSTTALQRGIPLHAWVNNERLEQVFPKIDGKRNLTIWYAYLLLEKKLSPFVKKAVFTNSRELVADQGDEIIKFLEENAPDYATLISSYIQTHTE